MPSILLAGLGKLSWASIRLNGFYFNSQTSLKVHFSLTSLSFASLPCRSFLACRKIANEPLESSRIGLIKESLLSFLACRRYHRVSKHAEGADKLAIENEEIQKVT